MTHTPPSMTLVGALIKHAGHVMTSQTNYEVPDGKVFGTPHVILYCTSCREVIHDEAIGAPVT